MQENTVSYLLKKYRQEKNMHPRDIAAITGISETTIKSIERGQGFSAYTVYLLSENLSKAFEPFIEYKLCSVCGQKFIPRKKNVKTCSAKCSKRNCRMLQDEANRRIFAENAAVKQEERKKAQTKQINRPKAEEFERLSREAGMTYGQRQSLERMGMLRTG